MDMASNIKLCGLCSQLVDVSVDIGAELKNFLDGFLALPHLPSKMCLECYQGATQCVKFKEQCLKSTEKILKCKLATSMILGNSVNSLQPNENNNFYNEVPTSNSKILQRCEKVTPVIVENGMVNVTLPMNSLCSSEEEIVDIETSSLEQLENNELTSVKTKVGIPNTKSTSIDESLIKSESRIRKGMSKFFESLPSEEVLPMPKRLRSQDSIPKLTSEAGISNITPASQKGVKIDQLSTSNSNCHNSKTSQKNITFNKSSSKAPVIDKGYPFLRNSKSRTEIEESRKAMGTPDKPNSKTKTLRHTNIPKQSKRLQIIVYKMNLASITDSCFVEVNKDHKL